jgi:hypothetical protein
MKYDDDVWETMNPQDAWVYDKLILAKRLGYECGPAGVAVKATAFYIVRPISNYRGMGLGSSIRLITKGEDIIPDGYFWCEVFQGRHFSFDYHYGQQCLAVEGIKDSSRTDRFAAWRKVDYKFDLPDFLRCIAKKHPEFNCEMIGNQIIEVHLRYNPDFVGHDSNEIIPIWRENFLDRPDADRVGFLLK